MSTKLIILLGHENDPDGNLSEDARQRASRAIELLNKDSGAVVLPTGYFGYHFNLTNTAHAQYLTEFLLNAGIPKGRILPFTSSSNTIQDALSCRKVAIDINAERVIVISSDYHMERVRFVFSRIFRGLIVEFESVSSAAILHDHKAARKLRRNELKKLKRTEKEWIEIPLYRRGTRFPVHIYKNAANEQRQYDVMSLSVVSGLILFAVYPLAHDGDPWKLYAAAVLSALLLALYELMARNARMARRLMARIEISYDMHGFSSSYDLANMCRKSRLKRIFWSMKRTVESISISLIIMLLHKAGLWLFLCNKAKVLVNWLIQGFNLCASVKR